VDEIGHITERLDHATILIRAHTCFQMAPAALDQAIHQTKLFTATKET
jgi:hypothetical protein